MLAGIWLTPAAPLDDPRASRATLSGRLLRRGQAVAVTVATARFCPSSRPAAGAISAGTPAAFRQDRIRRRRCRDARARARSTLRSPPPRRSHCGHGGRTSRTRPPFCSRAIHHAVARATHSAPPAVQGVLALRRRPTSTTAGQLARAMRGRGELDVQVVDSTKRVHPSSRDAPAEPA